MNFAIPTFQVALYVQTCGASKHTGGIQTLQQAESVASSATHMGATKHTGAHPNIQQGIQTYGWCPNMGASNIQGVSKHIRAFKHTGCIHTYGASKCMGACGHPLV